MAHITMSRLLTIGQRFGFRAERVEEAFCDPERNEKTPFEFSASFLGPNIERIPMVSFHNGWTLLGNSLTREVHRFKMSDVPLFDELIPTEIPPFEVRTFSRAQLYVPNGRMPFAEVDWRDGGTDLGEKVLPTGDVILKLRGLANSAVTEPCSVRLMSPWHAIILWNSKNSSSQSLAGGDEENSEYYTRMEKNQSGTSVRFCGMGHRQTHTMVIPLGSW